MCFVLIIQSYTKYICIMYIYVPCMWGTQMAKVHHPKLVCFLFFFVLFSFLIKKRFIYDIKILFGRSVIDMCKLAYQIRNTESFHETCLTYLVWMKWIRSWHTDSIRPNDPNFWGFWGRKKQLKKIFYYQMNYTIQQLTHLAGVYLFSFIFDKLFLLLTQKFHLFVSPFISFIVLFLFKFFLFKLFFNSKLNSQYNNIYVKLWILNCIQFY